MQQPQPHQQQGRGYPHAPYPNNQHSSYSSAPPPPEIEIYRRRVEELEAEKTRLSQLNMEMNNELFDLKACSAASATEAKVEARKEIEKVQSEAKLRERDLDRLTKENQSLLRQLSTLKQQSTAPTSSSSSSNGMNGGLNGFNGTSNTTRLSSGGGMGDGRNEGRLSARSTDSNGVRSASPRNAPNNTNSSGNSSARSTSSRHDGGGGGGANDAVGTMAASTIATTMSVRDEDSLAALQSVMHIVPGHGPAVTTQSVTSVGVNGGSSGNGSGVIDRTASASAATMSNTSLPAPPIPAGVSSSSSTSINRQQTLHNNNISTKWSASKGYCVSSGSLIAALLPLYQRLLIRPPSLSTRQHTPITDALNILQGSFNDIVVQMALVTNTRGIGGSELIAHHLHGTNGERGTGEGNRKSEGSSSDGDGVVGLRTSRPRDVALMISLQLIALTGSVVDLTQAVLNHQQDQHSLPQLQAHTRYDQRHHGNTSYDTVGASPSPHEGDDDDVDDDEDTLQDMPTSLPEEHLQYLYDCLLLVHAVTEYLDIEAVHLLVDARLDHERQDHASSSSSSSSSSSTQQLRQQMSLSDGAISSNNNHHNHGNHSGSRNNTRKRSSDIDLSDENNKGSGHKNTSSHNNLRDKFETVAGGGASGGTTLRGMTSGEDGEMMIFDDSQTTRVDEPLPAAVGGAAAASSSSSSSSAHPATTNGLTSVGTGPVSGGLVLHVKQTGPSSIFRKRTMDPTAPQNGGTQGGGTVAMYGTASTGKNVSFAGSSGALLTPLLTSDGRSKGGLTGSSGSGTLSSSSRCLSSDSISSRLGSMHGYDDEHDGDDGGSSSEQAKNQMESVCRSLVQALTLPSLSLDDTRDVVRRTLGQGLGADVGGGVKEGRSIDALGATGAGEGGGGGGGQISLQTTQPTSSHGPSQPLLHPGKNSLFPDDSQSFDEKEWQQQMDFILSPWLNLPTALVQMVTDACVRACLSNSKPQNAENFLKSGVKELLVGIVRNARAVLLLTPGDMLPLMTTSNVSTTSSSSSSASLAIAPLPYLLLLVRNHHHHHTPELSSDHAEASYPHHQPRSLSTSASKPTTERDQKKNGLLTDSCLLSTLSDLLKDSKAFEGFVEGQGLRSTLGETQRPGLAQEQGLAQGQKRANNKTRASTRAGVKGAASPFVLDRSDMGGPAGSPPMDQKDEEDVLDAFPRVFFRHLGLCLLADAQGQGLGPAQGLGQGSERLSDLIDCTRFKLLIARCLVGWIQSHGLYAVAALLSLPRKTKTSIRVSTRSGRKGRCNGPSSTPAFDLEALLHAKTTSTTTTTTTSNVSASSSAASMGVSSTTSQGGSMQQSKGIGASSGAGKETKASSSQPPLVDTTVIRCVLVSCLMTVRSLDSLPTQPLPQPSTHHHRNAVGDGEDTLRSNGATTGGGSGIGGADNANVDEPALLVKLTVQLVDTLSALLALMSKVLGKTCWDILLQSSLHDTSDTYFLTHLKAVNSMFSHGSAVHGSIINGGWFHADDCTLEFPDFYLENRWASTTELHEVLSSVGRWKRQELTDRGSYLMDVDNDR